MEITIKELLMFYNGIKEKIAEKQNINYTYLERMLDYRDEYFEEKEKTHKKKLENDKEYNRLLKLREQLENIVIKIDIDIKSE